MKSLWHGLKLEQHLSQNGYGTDDDDDDDDEYDGDDEMMVMMSKRGPQGRMRRGTWQSQGATRAAQKGAARATQNQLAENPHSVCLDYVIICYCVIIVCTTYYVYYA